MWVAEQRPAWALMLKRAIDVAGVALGLALLAPAFAAIAAAIRLTDGPPVFYPWRVVGEDGRPFTGYKFRTMVRDADARVAALRDRNEMTGPVFKMRDDPRVTRVGRFLRRTSLDELPQLWSVLRGDMSLVGPRPPCGPSTPASPRGSGRSWPSSRGSRASGRSPAATRSATSTSGCGWTWSTSGAGRSGWTF